MENRSATGEVREGEQRVPDRVVTLVTVVLAVYHLLFVSTVFPRVGIYIMTQQHRAVSLGLFLTLAFLIRPARKESPDSRLPWYDMILILASLLPTAYYAIFYSTVQEHSLIGYATTTEIVLCFLLLVAILEAGRRVVGWILPSIVIFFIIHTLFTGHFPGILFGRALSLERVVARVYLSPGGIFGFPVWIAGTIVITFILFSQLLFASGAGKFFLNLAMSLVGSMRGGPAKVAVIASSFFATLSGSTTANVAATGSITIPLMKGVGYEPHFAAAVEAVASKGGQITPPIMGAVIFLMVDITDTSYLEVCIAATLPAILYYLAIFLQVDFRAARTGLRGLPRSELPSLKQTLKEGWHYLIPLLALVTLIVLLQYAPEMAAFYAMVVLWVVTLFRKESRLSPQRLVSAFKSGASIALYAAIPCALAGIILASLSSTGLGLRFSGQVINLAGGNLAALAGLAALASFILGIGMTSIAIYVILAVLIAPGLIEMGVHILAAHLFIIFWGNVSFITPPVAIAAFAAAGIAGADPMKTGWQAVRLGIVSFLIPFIFIWDPSLILVGSPGDILLTGVTSVGGIALLASAIEGYLPGGAMRWFTRMVLLGSALLLLIPGWRTDIVGLVLVLPTLLWRIRTTREAKLASAPP